MHPEQSQRWAAMLKALAHPTRLLIVAELLQRTRCVTDMEDVLPVSQANISQHLSVLRHAGIVDFAQDGALRCYYLSRPQLVAGILELLLQDNSPIRKTKEQIQRESEINDK